VHTVMNTAAHSGSNTAYSACSYEHSSTQWQ